MNKDFILDNLKEAKEELNRTIQEIEKDQVFDYNSYLTNIMHIYQHLNFAWNIRNVTSSRVKSCSKSDFNKWKQFPRDIEM